MILAAESPERKSEHAASQEGIPWLPRMNSSPVPSCLLGRNQSIDEGRPSYLLAPHHLVMDWHATGVDMRDEKGNGW